MLILDLMEWATQKQWVYQHSWCVGDLLVWDNRATMRSEERRVGKECISRCDWSSDVCSSDLMLILDLMEWATQKQWVYQHSWCVGDLLVWDNRATMHRGRPFPDHQIRELRRTTLTNSVKLTPLDHHDNHLEHSFNVASA